MPSTLSLAPNWRPRLLTRKDLPAKTLTLASFLVGKLLVHRAPGAWPAVASSRPRPIRRATPRAMGFAARRNATRLDSAHGHVYVYRAYGSAWMLNFSSETAGTGAGVLVRALEPLIGLDLMRARRPEAKPRDLARGPGRLAAALGIDPAVNGKPIGARGPILLADDGFKASIGRSARIGITRNVEPRWRFFERGSAFVSGPRILNA